MKYKLHQVFANLLRRTGRRHRQGAHSVLHWSRGGWADAPRNTTSCLCCWLMVRGAAINDMSCTTYGKLGKVGQDLIQTDTMLKDFERKVSLAREVINFELTIKGKTLPTTFFVINAKGSYGLLLGQDWIYINSCIPSTMHQCLVRQDWIHQGWKAIS